MAKFRQTKEDLERRCYAQLAYLEVLGRRVQLLEKQNELLLKYNHKLIEELGDRTPPIPYKISRKKTSKDTWDGLAAED
ncbi:MAG: hypothetical protein JST26_00170 [Bacteroidetes bacterium]|nr:hypothetical protein [Bacteroidota bacterium]